MGYSILTQEELDNVDLNNVKIDGIVIVCVPRSNVAGDKFIIQGDQFTQYTQPDMLQYIKDNWGDWNEAI